MQQFRSKVDYAQIYAGDKQGFNIGLDGSIFIRKEAVPRTFSAPRIGTQGSSIGDAGADTDISGGTDNAFKIAVDGGLVVDVVLTLAGLTTGAAIATELESKINAALAAASQDARVWTKFDIADDHYEIYSQTTGDETSVVITNATANNVADDLKIGVANGGTEAVGTDDQDFLLYTTGGPTYEQPIESNAHRTGRFHTGIIKQKKVAEFDIDTYINMSGSAGASLDNAVRLLLESIFGKETVTPGTSITYEQDLPNFYFSMARVSTIFGEYYTGCYSRDFTLTLAGDAPGTFKFTGKCSKAAIAGIAQINGDVVGSANVILEAGQYKRYDVGARVMVVNADGRTIVAGADGSLLISSINGGVETIVLSTTVDAEDTGYIVPWHPGAMQQTGRDNVYTDLEGSMKLNQGGSNICVTNITLSVANDHVDRDNCFGADANQGFVAGNRCTMSLSVAFDLSNENFADVVQARNFEGFAPEIIVGNVSARHLKITAPNWIPAVPPIEVPENGTTPVTLEGNLYQSAPGAKDPIKLEFK